MCVTNHVHINVTNWYISSTLLSYYCVLCAVFSFNANSSNMTFTLWPYWPIFHVMVLKCKSLYAIWKVSVLQKASHDLTRNWSSKKENNIHSYHGLERKKRTYVLYDGLDRRKIMPVSYNGLKGRFLHVIRTCISR